MQLSLARPTLQAEAVVALGVVAEALEAVEVTTDNPKVLPRVRGSHFVRAGCRRRRAAGPLRCVEVHRLPVALALPAEVVEAGEYVHPCEGEMVCKLTNTMVSVGRPLLLAPGRHSCQPRASAALQPPAHVLAQ